LDKEVYESKEFADYAKQNLVLVRADFPRAAQSDALKKANADLKKKYADPFRGYPTTVLVESDGKKINEKIGYAPGSGPKAFIKALEELRAKK
jgi:protein disulfide-isomerase